MHRARNRDDVMVVLVNRVMLATPTEHERPVVALRDDQNFLAGLHLDRAHRAFHKFPHPLIGITKSARRRDNKPRRPRVLLSVRERTRPHCDTFGFSSILQSATASARAVIQARNIPSTCFCVASTGKLRLVSKLPSETRTLRSIVVGFMGFLTSFGNSEQRNYPVIMPKECYAQHTKTQSRFFRVSLVRGRGRRHPRPGKTPEGPGVTSNRLVGARRT